MTNNELEVKVAALEMVVNDIYAAHTTVLHIIVRQDKALKDAVVESIRLALINSVETHPISGGVRALLQQLRDELLRSPDPSLVSALSQPPVRPVN